MVVFTLQDAELRPENHHLSIHIIHLQTCCLFRQVAFIDLSFNQFKLQEIFKTMLMKSRTIFRNLFLQSLLSFICIMPLQSICQDSPMTLTGQWFGQTSPGSVPVLFAPPELQSNSEWFWHGGLVFSPDGTEFYMDIYYPNANPSGMRVRQMIMTNNVWSPIQTAPCAGDYLSAGMSFNNNGNTVYWVSDRPESNFWKSSKVNGIWSNAAPVYYQYPSGLGSGWRLSVANSERIYAHFFGGGNFAECDIYTINRVNGQYLTPQKMSVNVNSDSMDINAFIDPDEEYLIFESNREGGLGETDLYISFRKPDNTWTPASNFGYPINTDSYEMSPYVSADKQFLFFLSERDGDRNPYWVSAAIIDSIRQVILSVPENSGQRGGPILYQNTPNPCYGQTFIRFRLTVGTTLSIIMYNQLGQPEFSPVTNQTLAAGEHSIYVPTGNLTPGIHYYVIQTSAHKPVVGKITVLGN